MISFDAEFDFRRIRDYHPDIKFIASAKENRNESISAVLQTAFVDVNTEIEYADFLSNYDHLLKFYDLEEESVFDILYLTQITYSDIEKAKELNFDYLEMDNNLTFLIEVIKMQEEHKPKVNTKYPNLNLIIQSNGTNESAVLKNPMVTNYIIQQIIKAFKDKSYNSELATSLENLDLTSSNLKVLKKQLNYRSTNVSRYCTAQTACRINKYLNEQTAFSSPTGGLLNKQARFVFDILKEFNLLKNIINLKDIPRDKSKLENYKTSIIKALIKNHLSMKKDG